MIVPTKHLPLDKSVLGAAAMVLRDLPADATVSEGWEVAAAAGVATFDLYIAALDLLFLVGLIEYRNGVLARS